MARETRIVMGMPVTVEIVDEACPGLLEGVFDYFAGVDERFSLYKADSEITALNQGRIKLDEISGEMREVLELAERTKRESDGYFDINRPQGGLDPSGIVKGWAVRNGAEMIRRSGAQNYYVDAGGDIQSCGRNSRGEDWTVGIRNPFNAGEIIKKVEPAGRGIATSGTSARGQHIYNPRRPLEPITDVVSLTIIGSDVLEADRFATAAFAMGARGIQFVEQLEGLEGYLVNAHGVASWTSGFGAFVTQ
jgi:FAD:protein FMN transferase